MNKENLSLLYKVLSIPSAPSHEEQLAEFYMERLKDKAQCGKDVLGNTSAAILESINGSKVMLAAHMDEVAIVVTSVEEDGFLRFKALGGIEEHLLPGSVVIFPSTKVNPVRGIVGITKEEDEENSINIADMYIDIGAKSRAASLKKVSIGDFAVWDTNIINLSNDLVSCRGADNKLGCYIVLRVMEMLAESGPHSLLKIFGVLSSSEELLINSSSCAISAATDKIQPGSALIVDICDSNDYPDTKSSCGSFSLTGGPVISNGPLINKVLYSKILEGAKTEKITIQHSYEEALTYTDLDYIRGRAGGVACALISVPIRYIHSPQSVFSLNTLEKTIKLVYNVCLNIPEISSFVA